MQPLTFLALVTLISLLYFVYVGINCYWKIDSQDDFFLLRRHLTKGQFSGTFAASSTSLSTALIFFVTLGTIFGLPVLLAPITYFAGTLVLIWAIDVPKVQQALKEETGLYDFLSDAFGSEIVALLISLVPALGAMSILLLELYVGVSLFSLFSDVQPENSTILLGFVSAIIILYSCLGGFPAVVKTDAVQLRLMWIGALMFLGYILYRVLVASPDVTFGILWFPNPIIGNGFFLLPIAIFLNVVVVNAFVQFTQLRTWQMLAAAENATVAKVGLIRGAFATSALWTIFSFVGILAGPVLHLNTTTIQDLLISLAVTNDVFVQYAILTVFFVACLSALISTADSALLPLSQFICQCTKISPLDLRAPRLLIAALVIVANLLYVLVFQTLGYDFVQLLFTIFGIVIASGPAILTGLFLPALAKSAVVKGFALASVYAGCTVNLAVSYLAPPHAVPYGAPLSVLVASALILIGIVLWRLRQPDRAAVSERT